MRANITLSAPCSGVLGQLEALRQVLRGQCELQSGTGVGCLLQVPKTESVA